MVTQDRRVAAEHLQTPCYVSEYSSIGTDGRFQKDERGGRPFRSFVSMHSKLSDKEQQNTHVSYWCPFCQYLVILIRRDRQSVLFQQEVPTAPSASAAGRRRRRRGQAFGYCTPHGERTPPLTSSGWRQAGGYNRHRYKQRCARPSLN
jgi:hypothetical protein